MHVHALQDRVPDDVYYNAKNTDMHGQALQDRASDDMYDKDAAKFHEEKRKMHVHANEQKN